LEADSGEELIVIPASFDYAAPETLSEALKLLKSNPEAKVLAGGQSLIPLLKLRLAAPTLLIDLGRIPDLHFIAEAEGKIRIGAMTTHHQVEISELLGEKCPLLARTAAHIGDVQVRNRGTIGGSVAHADPAADYPAALQALEAKVKVVGPKGERIVGIDEFLVDALTTSIEPGEIVTEIEVPVEKKGTGISYRTMIQPASGYAIVGAAVRLGRSNGQISFARVGLTGVGSKPYRAAAVEKALEGKAANAATFRDAAAHAAEGVDALSDINASAEYRAQMAAVHVRRALEEAAAA
jgi:carbon-monoxide dehydrogenase medium subunit